VSFLCDTNIISELIRPQPNPGVVAWTKQILSIFISVITLEEIVYGLAAKPNARVQAWWEEFQQSNCQILPITVEIAQRSGELRGQLRTQGKPRSQADMLIAATAQINQFTLVTRNIRDFEDCSILLLNPFT